MKFRTLAVALVAIALTIAPTSAVAAADTTTTGGSTVRAANHPRLKLVCARVPNLLTRVDNLTKRLPAGPDTKGSIASIKDRADRARARGNTRIATALDTRANTLTQKLPTLTNQKAKLLQIQTKCQQYGLAK